MVHLDLRKLGGRYKLLFVTWIGVPVGSSALAFYEEVLACVPRDRS
jgi:hypothetical protein